MTTTTRFLLTLLLGSVTSVASAETIGEALAKCKRIDNSLERLICYDDVVANIRGMQGVSSEVSSVAVPVAKQTASSSVEAASSIAKSTSAPKPNSAAPASDFGLQKKREAESDGVSATIVSVSKTALGKYKMTLDNGMVWQQTDSTIFLPREGDTVTVERGMLGSFYLSKNDLNKTVKVKRIK